MTVTAGMILFAIVGTHGISQYLMRSISQRYLNLKCSLFVALAKNRCRADYCSFDVSSF